MGLETPYQFHTLRRRSTFNDILQAQLPTRHVVSLALNARGVYTPQETTAYPDYVDQCERFDLKPFSRRTITDEAGHLDFPEDETYIRIPKNIEYGSLLYWDVKRLRTIGELEVSVQVQLTDRFFPDFMRTDHPLLLGKGYAITWAEIAFYDPKELILDTAPSQACIYLNPGAPFSVRMVDGQFRNINNGVSLFIEEDTSRQRAQELIDFFKIIKEPTQPLELPLANEISAVESSIKAPGSSEVQ